MNINELKDWAYQVAVKHGWYEESHSASHHMMMAVTELSEAVNAERMDRYADLNSFHEGIGLQAAFEQVYESYIKDSVEDELADAVIRMLSYAGSVGLFFPEDVFCKEKMVVASQTRKEWFEANQEVVLTFPEETMAVLVDLVIADKKEFLLDQFLFDVLMLAYGRDIDLLWFIEQKIKYNETRPYRHGEKKY